MIMKLTACVLVLLLASFCEPRHHMNPQAVPHMEPLQPSEEYTHHVVLSNEHQFNVYWRFVKEPNTKHQGKIWFEVHAKTTGYVGFGFSIRGGMEEGDVMMAWVKDGSTQFHDRWSTTKGQVPLIDTQQDWTLEAAEEKNGFTMVKFWRNLNTCDKTHDLDISEMDTQRLIWAIHPNDPDDVNNLPYHGAARGTMSMGLLGGAASRVLPQLPPDTRTVDMAMDKAPIKGSESTVYWCRMFRMPTIELGNQKHHMIRVDGLIDPDHKQRVHHLLLYGCMYPIEDKWHGTSWDCHDYSNSSLRNFKQRCTGMMFGWAIGAGPYIFPPEAGYTVGVQTGRPYFFRLEIHYDNPVGTPDYMDNSGLRLYATKQLRPNEALTLVVGNNPGTNSMVVPPGTANFVYPGYCDGQCLKGAMRIANVDSIKVFSMGLHTHNWGHKVKLRHFAKNGTELPWLVYDRYYDNNFQDFKQLENTLTINAGEDLLVECTYDTTRSSNPVYGGVATDDEMCIVFLGYYPALNITACSNVMNPNDTVRIAGGSVDMNMNFITPPQYAGKSYNRHLKDLMNSVSWTPEKADEYQKDMAGGKGSVQFCFADFVNSAVPEEHFKMAIVPKTDKPYTVQDSCTMLSSATNLNLNLFLLISVMAFVHQHLL